MKSWIWSFFHVFLRLLPRVSCPVLRGPLKGCRFILGAFCKGNTFAEGHLVDGESMRDAYPVLAVSVDEIVIGGLGIRPNVMKIDVEGAELTVLKGASATIQQARPTIFLSTHSDTLRTDCLDFLKEKSYRFDILSKDKEDPSEFMAYL